MYVYIKIRQNNKIKMSQFDEERIQQLLLNLFHDITCNPKECNPPTVDVKCNLEFAVDDASDKITEIGCHCHTDIKYDDDKK